MDKINRGSSEAGVIFVVAYILYVSMMCYLMWALYGDEIPLLTFSHFDMPGWMIMITGTWIVWVFEAIADFFILATFGLYGHDIPLWINLFFTIPFVGGIVVTIIIIIRG